MANLTSITNTNTGAIVTLDDGTSQEFLFPVVAPTPAPASGPTEADVQAKVDAAVEEAFIPPTA